MFLSLVPLGCAGPPPRPKVELQRLEKQESCCFCRVCAAVAPYGTCNVSDAEQASSWGADPGDLTPFSSNASDISGPDLDAETTDEMGRNKLSLRIM